MKTRIPTPAHPFPTAGGTYAAGDGGELAQIADPTRDVIRDARAKSAAPAAPEPVTEPEAEPEKPRKQRKA